MIFIVLLSYILLLYILLAPQYIVIFVFKQLPSKEILEIRKNVLYLPIYLPFSVLITLCRARFLSGIIFPSAWRTSFLLQYRSASDEHCQFFYVGKKGLYFPFFSFFFPLFLRERDRAWVGEGQRERERDRQTDRQTHSCQHRAPCRAQTHEMWDHDLSQSWMLNQLSHPGAPILLSLKKIFLWV